MVQFHAARIGIDDECRVDQIAVLLHKPVRAVELAPFLVGGQGQDEVALRLVALPMQAQESRHQRGIGLLHVLRAATIEVAVLFNELKRIGMPIGAQGLHHIDVAEKEYGLLSRRTGSAVADNEIHLARIRPDQMHVVCRESCIKKALLHGLRGGRHVALGRVGGVDFDELLEDLACFCAFGGRSGGQRTLGKCGQEKEDGSGWTG